ncbi:MAG TPA: hypothetical protein VF303_04810 [Candidatus Nanoarchaeia archaeon]
MTRNGSSENKHKSIYKSTLAVLMVFGVGLLLTRVVFSNILATSGQRLAAANQKISVLQEENQKLENEISRLSSLVRVEGFAQKKGFVKSINVKILAPSGPIANR